ncbi:MAG: GNAT family N-acetyltransferase [Alphaproteobacteria bacterium]
MGTINIRPAESPADWEAVERLNYDTFVVEIPQHPPNESKRLYDPKLERATMMCAWEGDILAGMISVSWTRPFSLDLKLPNVDELVPAGSKVAEFRLLAVRPPWRRSRLAIRMIGSAGKFAVLAGCTHGIVSAYERQAKMYSHLGGYVVGPPIGTPSAPYRMMVFPLTEYVPLGVRPWFS